MTDDRFRLPEEQTDPFSVRRDPEGDPAINPYAPTILVSGTDDDDSSAEGIRRKYLNHEASVKSVGWLYLLPGVILVGLAMIMIVMVAAQLFAETFFAEESVLGGLAVAMVYGALGGLQLYAGMGMRQLNNTARRLAIIFSTFGLLLIPVGTLINAYILYLLLSKKGKMVFSDRYQVVIGQTPHIEYRTSMLVKILGVILIVVIGFGITAVFLG